MCACCKFKKLSLYVKIKKIKVFYHVLLICITIWLINLNFWKYFSVNINRYRINLSFNKRLRSIYIKSWMILLKFHLYIFMVNIIIKSLLNIDILIDTSILYWGVLTTLYALVLYNHPLGLYNTRDYNKISILMY